MIQLQTFGLADWKLISDWISSEEELFQFAGPTFDFPLTSEQIEVYLSDRNRLVFKVIDSSSLKTIGMAEIYHVSNNVAKLARILIGDNSARGKGLGFVLIQKLTKYCFEHLEKDKTILNVFIHNSPAIKCYEKVGFSKSDRKLDLVNVGNEIWESMQMNIKKDDFAYQD